MSALAWSAYGAHWLLILAWSACHWQISAARKRTCRPSSSGEHQPRPSVTVILPAKDEASEIEGCAGSVLAQTHVDLSLVIVNDRSSDTTGLIADRIAAADNRCRVIHVAALPEGWMGKSHACANGAAGAQSEWLLFSDADVRLEPAALASSISYARRHALDLFSLWPRDGSRGFWERLLIPLCGAMIVLWYGGVATRSNSRGGAFANGQFLLIRRQAYEACGGHSAVRTALIEDIALARVVARRGFAVGSALGSELACVRMYRGLSQVIAGWSRIYVGVLTPLQIVGSIVSLAVGSLLPLVLTPVMLATVLLHGATVERSAWLLSSAAQTAVLFSVSVRFFSLARCRLRYLWLYPASVAGVMYILLAALRTLTLRRPVLWRGTRYAVDSSGHLRPPPACDLRPQRAGES